MFQKLHVNDGVATWTNSPGNMNVCTSFHSEASCFLFERVSKVFRPFRPKRHLKVLLVTKAPNFMLLKSCILATAAAEGKLHCGFIKSQGLSSSRVFKTCKWRLNFLRKIHKIWSVLCTFIPPVHVSFCFTVSFVLIARMHLCTRVHGGFSKGLSVQVD